LDGERYAQCVSDADLPVKLLVVKRKPITEYHMLTSPFMHILQPLTAASLKDVECLDCGSNGSERD